MPYIKRDGRASLLGLVEELAKEIRNVPEKDIDGRVNYAVTMLLANVYAAPPGKERGASGNYYTYNRALGVLEAVKLEYYRRAIAPYEDGAIERNGDVY